LTTHANDAGVVGTVVVTAAAVSQLKPLTDMGLMAACWFFPPAKLPPN